MIVRFDIQDFVEFPSKSRVEVRYCKEHLQKISSNPLDFKAISIFNSYISNFSTMLHLQLKRS